MKTINLKPENILQIGEYDTRSCAFCKSYGVFYSDSIKSGATSSKKSEILFP